MTDFNFDLPERYNETIADEGVWFSVYDENNRLWGEFKCALYDTDSRRMKKAQEALKVKYAKEIRTKSADAEVLGTELFLDAILLDWKLNGKDGKAIKFSKEAASAYFAQKPVAKFVLPALLEYSQEVRNYQVAPKEEVSGN